MRHPSVNLSKTPGGETGKKFVPNDTVINDQ
jgi:DNA mismatch repair ATPase MutS